MSFKLGRMIVTVELNCLKPLVVTLTFFQAVLIPVGLTNTSCSDFDSLSNLKAWGYNNQARTQKIILSHSFRLIQVNFSMLLMFCWLLA